MILPFLYSERAQGSMSDQLAGGNDQRADHFLNQVAVALSKVRQFSSEAAACVGEQDALEGSTQIQVSSDAISDGDDTSSLLGSDALIGQVNPPDYSPFQ